jgi:hypothetical protein
VCKVCNESGKCNTAPADDDQCGAIGCAGLSTDCRSYEDVAHRCVAAGLCAAPNDPMLCTQYTDVPDGTECSGGTCYGGRCVGGVGGGCSLGGSGGSFRPFLLFFFLTICRASRKSRSRRR